MQPSFRVHRWSWPRNQRSALSRLRKNGIFGSSSQASKSPAWGLQVRSLLLYPIELVRDLVNNDPVPYAS